jgi:hypothetical protein
MNLYISDVFIQKIIVIIIVYNIPNFVNYIRQKPFPDLNELTKNLFDFFVFISKNNFSFIDYYENYDVSDLDEQEQEQHKNDKNDKKDKPYEDKYLEKFKKFPNEFHFSELELEDEKQEYDKLKESSDKRQFDQIKEINLQLEKIIDIQNNGNITNTGEDFTKNISHYGLNKLLLFFDLQEDYNDDPESIDIEELYMDLIRKKGELEKELLEIESNRESDEDYRTLAREKMINKKLDTYINNYVLEYTPLGNIYMRYNNDKKSFEYFSNNTIPYRYLEPVGRKYVMTYWCKPIFVDIEEELKKAEAIYDEEKTKRESDEVRKNEERKINPNKIFAQLKSYNKDTKVQTTRPMKNRTNNVLSPQIQANLPQINKPSDKQLLKKNANRYTWEGRLANFSPLKKIDKKIVDKNLSVSYADFKKMQQHQNKK